MDTDQSPNQYTSRFTGSKKEFELLENESRRLEEEGFDFQVRKEKPLERYYGGAHELMNFFSKNEQLLAPKKDFESLLENLQVRALPHSYEETGQKEIDEHFQIEELQTPDSQSRKVHHH